MELKLWLSFLMVCGIPEVQSASNQWLIKVPSNIPALQGSCVVIPCVYTYPKTKKILNRWVGFWKRGEMIVSTNLPKIKLTQEFRKRTKLMGNLRSGNCTMRISSVRTTDVGPFYLRIEIPQHKSFTFSTNTVTIDVSKTPEPPTMSLDVLDKVKATCTVSHTCPTSPPRFYWSRSGKQKMRSKRLNDFMWTTESTLMFVPLPSDFNQPLNCTVVYSGKKSAQSSMILFR
ncbi:myeloid cell surface antigen CD33 [Fundulus heteroclitus]|uniref:myeloid cell surface antigen CD33 n=1 Tax=Fundulus heteroclitus TaxID=8078 RepID=UPI00165BC10B|nr:myeloid cell surface antigen CD33 [Fundulus heteroclitus]